MDQAQEKVIALNFKNQNLGIKTEKEWNEFSISKEKALEVLKDVKGAYAFTYFPNIVTKINPKANKDVKNNGFDYFVVKDGKIVEDSLHYQFSKENKHTSIHDLKVLCTDWLKDKHGIDKLYTVQLKDYEEEYDMAIYDLEDMQDNQGKAVVFFDGTSMDFDVYNGEELDVNFIIDEFNEFLVKQGTLKPNDTIRRFHSSLMRIIFRIWLEVNHEDYIIVQLKN